MGGTLLLLTDFSPSARAAEDLACQIGQSLEAGIEVVHVLKVPWEYRLVPEPRQREIPEISSRVNEAEKMLNEIADRVRDKGIKAQPSLWYNEKVQEIPLLSGESYDMVIMGTTGKTGWQNLLKGSVAERIIKETDIPVLMVKPSGHPNPLKRVLFASSLEPDAKAALQQTLLLAKGLGAEKVFVSRVTTPHNFLPSNKALEAYTRFVDDQEAGILEFAPINHHTIEDGIAELAVMLDIDLIALSTHGRKDLASVFLESVPIKLARSAPQPVLTLRNS